MTETKVQKQDVVVTRVLDAPVERAWQPWTDPELVKRWWGPNGFSAPVAKIDFRVFSIPPCLRASVVGFSETAPLPTLRRFDATCGLLLNSSIHRDLSHLKKVFTCKVTPAAN